MRQACALGSLLTAFAILAACGGSTTAVQTVTETQTVTEPITIIAEPVTITEPAPPRQDETTAEDEQETVSTASTTASESGLEIGDPARDGGLEIIVTDARVVDRVRRTNDEPMLRAQEGAQLVVVEIEFLNDRKQSVDIYCAFDFGVLLIDESDRRYDPVEDLDYVVGNTGCNEYIQPGFSTTETLVFRTPAGDPIKQLFFWDPNDGDDSFGEESAALIDLR